MWCIKLFVIVPMKCLWFIICTSYVSWSFSPYRCWKRFELSIEISSMIRVSIALMLFLMSTKFSSWTIKLSNSSFSYLPSFDPTNLWMVEIAGSFCRSSCDAIPLVAVTTTFLLIWIILRPLSALSLDEGLNAFSGKNPSAAGCFSRPIKCQILARMRMTFTSVCKYWQNKHGEWLWMWNPTWPPPQYTD